MERKWIFKVFRISKRGAREYYIFYNKWLYIRIYTVKERMYLPWNKRKNQTFKIISRGLQSLHTGQCGPPGRSLSRFCSMKRLGVFLLPPGWDASPSQGYPPALNSPVPIYTPGWREALWEHNVPARARTQTARSGDERTNHETTAPPN